MQNSKQYENWFMEGSLILVSADLQVDYNTVDLGCSPDSGTLAPAANLSHPSWTSRNLERGIFSMNASGAQRTTIN